MNDKEGVLGELESFLTEELGIEELSDDVRRAIIGKLSVEHSVSLETFDGGLFGDRSNFEKRFVPDYEQLGNLTSALRSIDTRIVLTSGSYDILHLGHARYLEKAREHGDLLIVGVDSDAKIKKRKGENRPRVPEQERLQQVAHTRGVGILTLKTHEHEKWELIKTVQPDTLIATEGTYTEEEIVELEENWVGRVVVLERQAETSTSARIRTLQLEFGKDIGPKILEVLGPKIIDTIQEAFDEHLTPSEDE